jgi:hypothetical protein
MYGYIKGIIKDIESNYVIYSLPTTINFKDSKDSLQNIIDTDGAY